MSATLLIADDDLTIRTVLGKALSRHGFNVRTTANAATLWHWASQGEGDLIITDVMMPDGNGLELVPSLQRLRPEVKIIVISAQNSLSTAVKTQELGVFGYLPKPFDLKELIALVDSALATNDLAKHRQADSADQNPNDFPLVGSSKPMADLFRKMGKYATSVSPLLISGASGTGKTLAGVTHINSGLSGTQTIQKVYANTFDARFFDNQAFENAMLIEDVEELTSSQQSILSAWLEQRKANPEFKVVATTSANIVELLKTGTFDRGLFDKLSVLKLEMPDLSKRLEDIPNLIEYFQNRFNSGLVFSPQILEYLKAQSWPGNVRQLENLVKRLTIFSDQSKLSLEQVSEAFADQVADGRKTGEIKADSIEDFVNLWVEQQRDKLSSQRDLYKNLMELIEKPLIEKVLMQTRNNQIKTSSILGLNRNTLRKKINELGIKLKK